MGLTYLMFYFVLPSFKLIFVIVFITLERDQVDYFNEEKFTPATVVVVVVVVVVKNPIHKTITIIKLFRIDTC